MKDTELQQLLKIAPVPERPTDYWENFPKRVFARIRSPLGAPASLPANSLSKNRAGRDAGAPRFALRRLLAPGLGFAVICLAIGITLPLWQSRRSTATTSARQLQEAQKYFHEIEGLFPNQLQAIVLDQTGARLVLSPAADVPRSPPLYLRICGPEGCQRFVTFSGQQIRVHGETCEVLVDRRGQIMLVGPKLFWSGSDPMAKGDRYQIEAATLATTS